MKYKLYRPEEMSKEQWAIYAALRNANPVYDDPFFDPDFARLVGDVRDDTRIGFASDRNGVFAVWPMHIRPGNWARPIGSPFSDWNGPILAPDVGLSASEILAGFEVSGLTTQGFLPMPQSKPETLSRVGAHLTDMSKGWTAYDEEQQRLRPKHYKKMRRVYRNLDRDFSDVQFVWDDKTDASFERLMELKQEQYTRTGYFNVLKAPWVTALFDRLRSFEGERLRGRLVSLSFDGNHAASEFNLQSDSVMHGWITAYEQSNRSYSPGFVLINELLPVMHANDLYVYDSGPGLDDYKVKYSNVQVPIETGTIPGAPGGLIPSRVAGQVWRMGEHVLPGKASAMMARARRRMDQIAATETSVLARASGLLEAITPRTA